MLRRHPSPTQSSITAKPEQYTGSTVSPLLFRLSKGFCQLAINHLLEVLQDELFAAADGKVTSSILQPLAHHTLKAVGAVEVRTWCRKEVLQRELVVAAGTLFARS